MQLIGYTLAALVIIFAILNIDAYTEIIIQNALINIHKTVSTANFILLIYLLGLITGKITKK